MSIPCDNDFTVENNEGVNMWEKGIGVSRQNERVYCKNIQKSVFNREGIALYRYTMVP